VTVPTPRSLRYNRRSGHLRLALLMCCFGEVQSSAISLTTPAPLCGPLAMIVCFVLIAALGASLYDYVSTVPTADTIVLPGHTCVVPASEIEELHRLRHYYSGQEDILRLDGNVYRFHQDNDEWNTIPIWTLRPLRAARLTRRCRPLHSI
jgi:hypothetical protein